MLPLCVVNTDSCTVSTRYQRVPHPSKQLIDDRHALRYTLTSVMYAYVGTPCRGARGHSGNDAEILSSSDVMIFVRRAKAL